MTTMVVDIARPVARSVDRSVGTITDRLARLSQFYQEGQTNPLLSQTLDKLFAYEIANARTQLEQLNADLTEFEAQYAMSSAQFYQRYQSGQTDDRMDFVEWAALVQMVTTLEKRLQLLITGN